MDDAMDTPISLMHDGITIAFYFVPGGKTESEAECRTALFLPCHERGAKRDQLMTYLLHKIDQAFRWGVARYELDELHPYDLTQPQMMAWFFQVVMLVERDTDLPIMAGVCTPEEAATHGEAVGSVLRVYASEGDVPAQWRVYRLLAAPDGRAASFRLQATFTQIITYPPEPVRKRPYKRRAKSAAPPAFSPEQQAALLRLQRGYNSEHMARDGAVAE